MIKVRLKVVQSDGQTGTRFMMFEEILMINETNGKNVKEVHLIGDNGVLTVTDEETKLSYNGKLEQVVQWFAGEHTFFESGEIKSVAANLPALY